MSDERKKGDEARRPGMTVPRRGLYRPDALISAFDTTALWRTLLAEQFSEADVRSIDLALGKVEMFGQPSWRDAVGGDAAAAIRVAVAYLPIHEITMQIDLVMTALVRCAIANDAAAAAAISVVLRNLPGGAPLHEEAGISWMVKNVRQASGRQARSPRKRRKATTDLPSNPLQSS